MIILNNFLSKIADNFHHYYENLTDESKLILFIIIILLFISVIILIMLLEKKNLKVMKITPKEILPKEEKKISPEFKIDVENEKTRNLKEITDKIKEDIDNKNINLTNFEQEQEETSIISYDELLKAVGQKETNPNEEKFSMSNLARKIEVDEVLEKELEPKVTDLKFKKSAYISPIFGIQDIESITQVDNISMEKEDEKTEEIELLFEEDEQPLKEETSFNEDEQFLSFLKEFRSNLN
ncbi:MAG: hypothetical protein ACOXZR_02805 [Bacilli bacterium]|jgi:hypothetical protein